MGRVVRNRNESGKLIWYSFMLVVVIEYLLFFSFLVVFRCKISYISFFFKVFKVSALI